MNPMKTFETLESEVRSYVRSFPVVFDRAVGSTLIDEDGREYLDFFAGAGVMSYGHNNPCLKQKLIEYLQHDGITHGLDLATEAKARFLERFHEVILKPRDLDYKLQFPGPTGTNAVEAALKLARKVTGRTTVVHFANSFHGMTLGSLAVTGNASKRAGAGVPLSHGVPMPFDGDVDDGLAVLERFLSDPGSGLDKPAAVILETIQAEGGVKTASFDWLRRLEALVREHGVLLIVDDIQVGCGRTGPFFSFEPAGIKPDLVCLSKALSGFGLPMALVLLAPEHDQWKPGEHNGTFRGHNLAFVTAAEALGYWEDDRLTRQVEAKARRVRERLEEIAEMAGAQAGLRSTVRGRGLIQGLHFSDPSLAGRISEAAFERGLVIETAGPRGEVLKLLPPLVIGDDELEKGLDVIADSLEAVVARAA